MFVICVDRGLPSTSQINEREKNKRIIQNEFREPRVSNSNPNPVFATSLASGRDVSSDESKSKQGDEC